MTFSGSDSPNSASPGKQKTSFFGIAKSDSFSGVIRKPEDLSPGGSKSGSGSATGTETEEETFGFGAKGADDTIIAGIFHSYFFKRVIINC